MQSDESIYSLLPDVPEPVSRGSRYKSKYCGTMAPTGSTFNLAQTNRPGVSNLAGEDECKDYGGHAYQKSKSSIGTALNKTRPEVLQTKSRPVATLKQLKETAPEKLKPTILKSKVKPELPNRKDKPIMNLVTKKNFIVSNAVENILAAPKKVVDVQENFMDREEYGKVPEYLGKIKNDIDAEYAYIRKLQEEQREAALTTKPLSTEDKLQMIEALKAKWEEVNAGYQLSTHLTKYDSVGKKSRKENYEAQLTQIEKDIEKMKRSKIEIDMTN